MSLCVVCRADLPSYDPERGTGQRGGHTIMDRICNSIVNPRSGVIGSYGSAQRKYEVRRDALAAIHEWLRGEQPGWGAYRPRQVRRLFQSELGAANRASLAQALEAELLRRPA